MKDFNKKAEIEKEIQELVKARLSVLPKDVCISVGSDGMTYDREQLISHVEKGDEIGKKMIEIDMEFLRALKTGNFYEQITSNN